MKKLILSAVLLISAGFFVSQAAPVGAAVGDVVSNAISDARKSFLHSIGDYYAAPQKEVQAVSAQKIPDDEIPVVYYIARTANVAPATIAAMRLKGDSWQAITNRYGYGPEIYYVPVNSKVVVGPPYGHAYGYYKNKPKSKWKTIKLEDGDIVNLVNLKFISEHYKYPPEKVMKMRQGNKVFSVISNDLEKQRKAQKKAAKAAPAKNTKASSSQGKNNKENKGNKASPGQVKKQTKSNERSAHSKGAGDQGKKGNKSQQGGKHENNGKK